MGLLNYIAGTLCAVGTSLISKGVKAHSEGVFITTQDALRWAIRLAGERCEVPVWLDPMFLPGWEPSQVEGEVRGYWGYNAGVSGQTCAQILARKHIVGSIPAEYHLVDMGTNDVHNETVEYIHNARCEFIEYLLGVGRKPILLTILARDLSVWPDIDRQKALATNQLTFEKYGNDPRVIVYDWNRGWRDNANPAGEPLPGASIDGTHLDGYGAWGIGRALAELLTALYPPRPAFYQGPDDQYDSDNNPRGNLLANSVLAGTGGYNTNTTGEVADSYAFERKSGTAVGVASKNGNAQRLVITPAGVTGQSQFYLRTGPADTVVTIGGQWLKAGAKISVVSGAAGIKELMLVLQDQSVTGTDAGDGYQSATNCAPESYSGAYLTPYLKLQDDCSAIRWRVQITVDDQASENIVLDISEPVVKPVHDPIAHFKTSAGQLPVVLDYHTGDAFLYGEPLLGDVKLYPYSSISQLMELSVGSSQEIRVSHLVGAISGARVTTADVSMVLKDAQGAEVQGIQWPLQLGVYEENNYRAYLPASLQINAGDTYEMIVTATLGDSQVRWVEKVPAIARVISKDRKLVTG